MTTSTTTPSLQTLKDKLHAIDQSHLLNFYDELTDQQQQALLAQIAALDLDRIPSLVDQYVLNKPSLELDPAALAPATYYPREGDWDRAHFRAVGEDLLRNGKVAAFTVAGGQGSRLGYDGPKGEYPAGAVSAKPLFACLADWILWATRKFSHAPLWAIMTSPLNHERTVNFFNEHNHFGLDPDNVLFFSQGVMPSFNRADGKVLLKDKATLATNPDGHGGSLRALHRSGALDTMRNRGIEHISYFHVDNPLVRVIDPTFLGLHAAAPDSSAQMSSKMVPKAAWNEKVGVFAHLNGKTAVIEYSDLPESLAKKADAQGNIAYNAGSVGIHTIAIEFVKSLSAGGNFSLPFHRADKRVPCINTTTGEAINPSEPNAVKLETFVFDAVPLADRSIVYETDRIDEFAPIKNAEGTDSPTTCHAIQAERAARILESAGVKVPRNPDGTPDCKLELAPTFAASPDEIDPASVPPITPGSELTLA